MMPFWMMCAFVARFWGVIIQCAESEKQTKPRMTCVARADALRRMEVFIRIQHFRRIIMSLRRDVADENSWLEWRL